jgi:hypothetical protein
MNTSEGIKPVYRINHYLYVVYCNNVIIIYRYVPCPVIERDKVFWKVVFDGRITKDHEQKLISIPTGTEFPGLFLYSLWDLNFKVIPKDLEQKIKDNF